jgi:hypothetical protein
MWQGATFGLTITVQDSTGANQDLTGYTARMQMRSAYNSGAAAETLTTANGEISIANSNVSITLVATRTANIYVDLNSSSKPPRTMYVYDLELIDNANTVSKLLYGEVTVYGEVTR